MLEDDDDQPRVVLMQRVHRGGYVLVCISAAIDDEIVAAARTRFDESGERLNPGDVEHLLECVEARGEQLLPASLSSMGGHRRRRAHGG